MTVTFSTKLPCIICLKKLYFCFSYAKSLWNWATGFFTFFYPGRINLFSPHWNVSLWISEAETFQIWAFSFSFWLWQQMKNFAIYKKQIYIFCQLQKPLIFPLCVPCPLDHIVLADLHSGDATSFGAFTSRMELPLITMGAGVGFQHSMHRRRDKRVPDKSSHIW